MTYTIEYRNEGLQSGRWIGAFDTIEAARESQARQASRSRAFCTYRVCYGTPRNPGDYVKGEPTMRGES